MMERFYIGSLELCYPQGMPGPLQLLDSRFRTRILPVTSSATVEIQPTDSIALPKSRPVDCLDWIEWNEPGRQTRFYKDPQPYLISTREGSHVTIRAEKTCWEKRKEEFRPWFNVHMENLLLENQALILHSASIIVDGRAIAFSAPSGTGKTTQTDLWHKYAQNVEDLNGDRTLLQKTENGWLACGFPVYGSVKRCEQRAVPIEAIVVTRRGPVDWVRELSAAQKMGYLYTQITVPSGTPESAGQAMNLVEDFIRNNRVIMLECTMERSAVDVLREYLNEKGRNV